MSVTGTPSKSLISHCKEPGTQFFLTPAPKMCDVWERIVGLTCKPYQNCRANGECLYGMDESDYLCESCHSGESKVRHNGQGGREGWKEAPTNTLTNKPPHAHSQLGQECTACYAGDATIIIFPAMALTFFAIIGAALYRASKSSPALAERSRSSH